MTGINYEIRIAFIAKSITGVNEKLINQYKLDSAKHIITDHASILFMLTPFEDTCHVVDFGVCMFGYVACALFYFLPVQNRIF